MEAVLSSKDILQINAGVLTELFRERRIEPGIARAFEEPNVTAYLVSVSFGEFNNVSVPISYGGRIQTIQTALLPGMGTEVPAAETQILEQRFIEEAPLGNLLSMGKATPPFWKTETDNLPSPTQMNMFPSYQVSTRPPITSNLGYVPIETVQTFIELLELPGRWNSYDAKQIRKENVTAAVNLLGRLMRPGTPAPIVVPKVRGGVQLEWHTKGVNLEIAIDSPADITFFAEDIHSIETHERDLNESTIMQWIDRVSK
jgi:hypothetical protein